MSENAIHVHATASATEAPSLTLAAGPGALRTTLLMARITFLEAARRKILWIATLDQRDIEGKHADKACPFAEHQAPAFDWLGRDGVNRAGCDLPG